MRTVVVLPLGDVGVLVELACVRDTRTEVVRSEVLEFPVTVATGLGLVNVSDEIPEPPSAGAPHRAEQLRLLTEGRKKPRVRCYQPDLGDGIR